ncbi:hypothetical protein NUSPORA_00363 [Nucleospora cyclopteri]
MKKNNEVKTNTFTDEGRLLQTEYAIKNVSEAGTIMGIVCTDGIVLVGINAAKTEIKEKIYKLDERTFCAVAGLFGDANRIIHYARTRSIALASKIASSVKTKTLCKEIAYEMQIFTQYSNTRPFGVSFLYAGYDDEEYVLYSTDPSGTINKWNMWAIGKDENSINSNFKNEYNGESFDMKTGTKFLMKSLFKARECNPEIAECIEVLHYSATIKRFLKTEEIENFIKEI